jgi:glycosyltransferase involved in cell wall biosynthesis
VTARSRLDARGANPLVSVVTPALNCSRFIEQTILSVSAQDYPRIEHIVVDGGSTDGTLEILARYPGLRWISEPDRGQSNAINKGVGMAQGEIIAWLNADDLYLNGAITAAVAQLTADERLGMVCADHVEVDEVGRELRTVRSPNVDLDVLRNRGNIISQPTVFMRRAAFESVGRVNEQYRYAMDYELWLRLVSAFPAKHVTACWAAFRRHDDQLTIRRGRAFGAEIRKASRANGGRFFSELGFTYSKPLRALHRLETELRRSRKVIQNGPR